MVVTVRKECFIQKRNRRCSKQLVSNGVNNLKVNYGSVITDNVYKKFKHDNVQFQIYQSRLIKGAQE